MQSIMFRHCSYQIKNINTYSIYIIDYVRENGDIVAEDLIEKSPFDNYDIVSLFGNNVPIVIDIVNAMHSSIIAA